MRATARSIFSCLPLLPVRCGSVHRDNPQETVSATAFQYLFPCPGLSPLPWVSACFGPSPCVGCGQRPFRRRAGRTTLPPCPACGRQGEYDDCRRPFTARTEKLAAPRLHNTLQYPELAQGACAGSSNLADGGESARECPLETCCSPACRNPPAASALPPLLYADAGICGFTPIKEEEWGPKKEETRRKGRTERTPRPISP